MALVLKYNLCVTDGCTQIKFTENTGFYSTVNTTGWGTPNVLLSNVVSAVLTIKGPDGISHNVNLFSTALFPSDTSNTEYTIPLASYGSPTTITDGQWYFLYTVTMNDTTVYKTTVYKYFYCNLECCVNSMLLNIETCDCCTTYDSYKNYVHAWTMLESLKDAAKCGDVTRFTSIKKIIDKLCLNSGCKTCK